MSTSQKRWHPYPFRQGLQDPTICTYISMKISMIALPSTFELNLHYPQWYAGANNDRTFCHPFWKRT